jgi:hypothetical protein
MRAYGRAWLGCDPADDAVEADVEVEPEPVAV